MARTHQQDADRKRRQRAAANEIRPIAPPVDLDRRERCRLDFLAFLAEYGGEHTFPWPWSDDHLYIIAGIQRVVLDGGQYLIVCPRGSSKSTLLEWATIWASCYGHRRYIVPITATGDDAADFLGNLKRMWETNDTLAADFDELAHPIRSCDGVTLRAKRLTIDGQSLHMEYSANCIVYPWHDDPAAFPGRGVIIEPRSITGRLRGARRTLPNGATVRPDLIIPDDIQDDESAKSPSQVRTRLRILTADALGMAGPGVRIAAIMLGTVIQSGDVIDTMLNDDQYHSWAGKRIQLIKHWPDAQDTLWQRYADLRRQAKDESTIDGKRAHWQAASDFYTKHRSAMDAGAVVMWESRKEPGELSALQHAQNLLIDRGRAVFFSEYQNDPETEDSAATIRPEHVLAKINRLKRWQIPNDCELLAAKIDVHREHLRLTVMASTVDGTPYCIHYQRWPSNFSQSLSGLYPDIPQEARIYQGLEDLAAAALRRRFTRDDGTEITLGRVHVDEGWERDVVRKWCRHGSLAQIAHPERGDRTSATSKPMEEWKRRPGERRGPGWLIQPSKGGVRPVVVDTNAWKTYLADRIHAPMGTAGCWTIFGNDPSIHRQLADECAAEKRIIVQVQGQNARERWICPPNTDNHDFDCLVGTLVALSILGMRLNVTPEAEARQTQTKPRRKLVTVAY